MLILFILLLLISSYPSKKNVFGSILYWNQPFCPSMCVSICAQNISFCQSTGGGIMPDLVTAQVYFALKQEKINRNVVSTLDHTIPTFNDPDKEAF